MAISGTEVEFVGPGIKANNPENTSYVQNMLFTKGAWEVRKGFGTVCEYSSTLSRYTFQPGILSGVEGYKEHLGSYLMKTDFGHKQIISVFFAELWDNQGKSDPAVSDDDRTFVNSNRIPCYAIQIYDLTAREHWEEIIYEYTSGVTKNRNTIEGTAFTGDIIMPLARPYYQTSLEKTYNTAVFARDAKQISFTEFNDSLFFGNESLGLYCYRPAAFIGNTCKAIDTLHNDSQTSGIGESSLISRLDLVNGAFADAYSYLTLIAGVKGLSKLGNRLVYLTDDALYFSDNNYPSSVVAGHTLSLPTENPITACREINGNLLIFTENETYLYQPTQAFFVNAGQLTKLSESVGCLSINSIVMFDNTIAWVAKTGVYTNSGNLAINSISEDIKPFFNNYLPNPLSSFRTQNGKANQTYKMPKISHQLIDERVTVCYSKPHKALMVTVPKERVTLVFNSNGEWSLWNYDSTAFSSQEGGESAPTDKVGVRDFMIADQILSDDDHIYAVAADTRADNKIKDDETRTRAAGGTTMEKDVNRTQAFSTYFLTRYGRGGGLDRSIHDEDYRDGIGEWRIHAKTPSTYKQAGSTDRSGGRNWGDFVLGKPQKIKGGWALGGTAFGPYGGVMVPVQIRFPFHMRAIFAKGSNTKLAATTNRTNWTDNYVLNFKCEFEFDSHNWLPLLESGTTRINSVFKTPNECLGAGFGNATTNFVMAAGREMQVYNANTGAAAADGNLIRIHYDFTAAGLAAANPAPAWSDLQSTYTMGHFQIPAPVAAQYNVTVAQPPLPSMPGDLYTLFWIPFAKKVPANAVSEMGIREMKGWVLTDNTGVGVGYRTRNYSYDFSSLGISTSANREDSVAQGVDWAYASEPIGLGQGKQIKARGLYSEIQSQGMSGEHFANGWTSDTANNRSYRLFNSTVAADNTQWMGQVVDQPSALEPSAIEISDSATIANFPDDNNPQEESIRTRVRNSTTGLMNYKVFDSNTNTWGQTNTDNGTVLIDDPQFGTIAESTSTRGEWVNWMLFGFVLDKAEKLVIKSSKAVIRALSGRRRKGHSGGQNDA